MLLYFSLFLLLKIRGEYVAVFLSVSVSKDSWWVCCCISLFLLVKIRGEYVAVFFSFFFVCQLDKTINKSVLFNNALNTLYLRLYDHSNNERGNTLLPHGLLFLS